MNILATYLAAITVTLHGEPTRIETISGPEETIDECLDIARAHKQLESDYDLICLPLGIYQEQRLILKNTQDGAAANSTFGPYGTNDHNFFALDR